MKVRALLYVTLSAIGISMMVNAPGILTGYGLVYAAAYYAALAFPPATAALLFLAAHSIAFAIAMGSRAAFKIVFLASLLMRTPIVYAAARLRERLGALTAALLLVSLDQLVALSTAILYYGNDGIHVGLDIYEILLAPFAYYAYKYTESLGRRGREGAAEGIAGLLASLAGLLAYYLGAYAFLSPQAVGAGAASAILLAWASRVGLPRLRGGVIAAALVVSLLGLALGGQALALNARVALYPFKPSSWGKSRWAQTQGGACPATSNVFEYTHDPPRLRIVEGCVNVTGVVEGAPKIEDDGDYCFDIKVIGSSTPLALGNYLLRKGRLHVEVVPHDQREVLDPIGGGVCPGDTVRVTGVLVVDTDHGMWVEVHPTYKISVIERNTSAPWPDCVNAKP